jgi:hypothetical protein
VLSKRNGWFSQQNPGNLRNLRSKLAALSNQIIKLIYAVVSPDTLNAVAEFHRTFHHPILNAPQIPAPARADLRVSLLAEELDELREAIVQNDIVAAADALCDLQYVLSGAVLEFGLGEPFRALFDEVQRSNLSKACLTVAEADATVAFYAAKGVDCHYVMSDEKYLVYRTTDNKTLKNVNYSPADLAGILAR